MAQGAGFTSIRRKQEVAAVGIEKVTGILPAIAVPRLRVPVASCQVVRLSDQRTFHVPPLVRR